MIEEHGVLEQVEGDVAWVRTERQSTCGSCAAKAGCGQGLLGKWLNRRGPRVRVLNSLQLSPGERVVIGVSESALLTGSLVVYLVPLLAMFVAGGLADQVAGGASMGDGLSIVAALIGLALSLFWVRWFGRRVQRDPRFQPVMLRRADTVTTGPAFAADRKSFSP